jgi:PAS domain S-box-containing protein
MARISIVEDEHIVAWDIKETLEKLGHTVVDRVVSGEDAIQSALINQPDLILMDIRLEGKMDGITAGSEIYHQLNIPVVYLTAHADAKTLNRATLTNPFGYIVKPFQAQSLQSTIQIALNRHQLEAAANIATEYLVNTFNSIGRGIIVTDRHGSIALMNPIAELLTGWQEAVAIGLEISQVFRLVWETDGIAIENPSQRAMRFKQHVNSPIGSCLMRIDGSKLPISDIAAPIFDRDGEMIGSVLVFHEIPLGI